MPSWALLAAAIAAEVIGTLALRSSDGFGQPLPTAAAVTAYIVAFYLLAQVLRELPVGLVYAIWAGAGTAIVAVLGVVLYGETATAVRALSIALIIVGLIGLNLGEVH
jgi:small multidrug resistance pump